MYKRQTITSPGNTSQPLTIGAYNHEAGNIYIHSGRGYTLDGRIKPDIAAPGVQVYGPGVIPDAAYRALNGMDSAEGPSEVPMIRKTGTSVAAAITAGAVANLLSWGIVEGNDPAMSEAAIRSYLVRGASRSKAFTYPKDVYKRQILCVAVLFDGVANLTHHCIIKIEIMQYTETHS